MGHWAVTQFSTVGHIATGMIASTCHATVQAALTAQAPGGLLAAAWLAAAQKFGAWPVAAVVALDCRG